MKYMDKNWPMGAILPFALPIVNLPSGWLPCDGSAIPQEYEEFITVLGSPTTPNLAGRTLIGAGVGAAGLQTDNLDPKFPATSFNVGSTGGEFAHELSINEMPSHTHGFTGVYGGDIYSWGWDGSAIPVMVNQGAQTDPAGGNLPHNNMQPYFVVSYIIYPGEPTKTK